MHTYIRDFPTSLMNPFRWLSQVILPQKPTREEIARARRGILSEVDASIRALQLKPTTKNQQTSKQLEKLQRELRKDFVEIIRLQRSIANRPILGKKGPIHDAAMRASHQLTIAQTEARINKAAWKARQLINTRVRMHALRARQRGRARRGSGAA